MDRECVYNHLVVNFVCGKTMCFNGSPTPQEAETIGLWNVLLWLSELGLNSVTIELNCLPVLNGLKTSTLPKNEFVVLLSKCRNLLSNFQSFQVSFTRRHANLAAHTLTRVARLYASSQVFNLISSCIETISHNEML